MANDRNWGWKIALIALAGIVVIVIVIVTIIYTTPTVPSNSETSLSRLSAWLHGKKKQRIRSEKGLSDEKGIYDLIVIGSGVSGLFCAARLKQFFKGMSILILDQGVQIGGRLESLEISGSLKAAELGGMRYFQNIDKFTSRIVEDLGLQTIDVPYVAPENLVYVRAVTTKIADLPRQSCKIYNLLKSEQGKTSQQLVTEAIDKTLTRHGIPRDRVTYDPYLNSISFWYMLNQQLSQEAVNYYNNINGYNFSLDNLSAAVGIDENSSISPAEANQQRFLAHGYQQLPLTLADRLSHLPQVDIRLQQQVVAIDVSSSDDDKNEKSEKDSKKSIITITVQPVKPKDIQDSIVDAKTKNGPPYRVKCKQLILAIPPVPMLQIDAEWPAQTLQDVQKLDVWEAFKMFLQFDRPWWLEKGLTQGRSVTDLNLRQVWYWTADPPTLMVYADNLSAVFWSPLAPPQPFPQWQAPDTVPGLVAEIKRQLGKMYSLDPSSLNIRQVAYRYWPYGNFFWRPTGDKRATQLRMMQPMGPQLPIYSVGDSFSNQQSWTNGAFQYCDETLIRFWDLPSVLFVPLSV